MNYVLITGATGGIGTALCHAFAAKNFAIALHYHSQKERANTLAEEIANKYQVYAKPYYANISDFMSVRTMFDNIERDGICLDALVNNAGIAQQKLFTDITPEEWRTMTATNLDSVFYCCREALRRFMLPRHSGAICNISSMWGQVGASCEVHYSAAKAGVIGLTKALAKEVGLSGIRVNCIAPGVILTDMMKDFDESTLAALKEETPLNTLGTPQNVAEAAVFLCTEPSKFITGQVLGVNGGFVV